MLPLIRGPPESPVSWYPSLSFPVGKCPTAEVGMVPLDADAFLLDLRYRVNLRVGEVAIDVVNARHLSVHLLYHAISVRIVRTAIMRRYLAVVQINDSPPDSHAFSSTRPRMFKYFSWTVADSGRFILKFSSPEFSFYRSIQLYSSSPTFDASSTEFDKFLLILHPSMDILFLQLFSRRFSWISIEFI